MTEVLRLFPDDVEANSTMGCVAQLRGDHALAVRCFRKALMVQPDDPALCSGLGISLYQNGDIEPALEQLQYACELDPASTEHWFNYGEALRQLARAREAIPPLRCALEIDPSQVAPRLALAEALANLGEAAASVEEFRKILQSEPDNARAWFGLSNLNTFRFDAADARRIGQALDRVRGQNGGARELLAFARAKALEDQGNYADAFEAFEFANRCARRRVPWSAAAARGTVQAIKQTCSDWVPPRQDRALGQEVILVASVPRSGSSLVEQMLASHPDVEGTNETRELPWLMDQESRRRRVAFPGWVPDLQAMDWLELGRRYLQRMNLHRINKPRFIDKNMANWYMVGPALAMLPASRVVIVRRDPLETCLACYRQRLSGSVGFTFDLDDMVDYMADFMSLTRLWIEKFPDRIFDLQYEELAEKPEQTLRNLLDFLHLPFSSACLEFHRTERAVLSSPSAAQVRQPLHDPVARVALYGGKLDSLRARLQAAGLGSAS